MSAGGESRHQAGRAKMTARGPLGDLGLVLAVTVAWATN
jgi:hypothetical protein